MLEACRPLGDSGHMKICLKEVLPYWCMGERFASLHRASEIKKGDPT